jgi:hypothetical protein
MRTKNSEPFAPKPQSDPYVRLACMVIGSAVKNYLGVGTVIKDIAHARRDADLFLFGTGPMHAHTTRAEEDMLLEDFDGKMVQVEGKRVVEDNDGKRFVIDGEEYLEEPFFATHEARRAHWFHQAGMAVPTKAVLLKDIHRWKAGVDAEKRAKA